MSNTPVLAAVIAIVVALISFLNSFVVQERRLKKELDRQQQTLDDALRVQEERLMGEFNNELRLQRERQDHELRAQEERLRTELRTEFMAEEAVKQLLSVSKWPKRSFEAISKRVGGFKPDELQKILVRAGAVRFYSTDGKKELWGLRDRNRDELHRERTEDELGKDEL